MRDDDEIEHAGVLSHEMPCPRCGHPPHRYLACGNECACTPEEMPGDRLTG